MDGRMIIICPWHGYDFDLITGQSSSGLKPMTFLFTQDTYQVEVVNGDVYVNTDRVLSLKPVKPTSSSAPLTNDKSDEASNVLQKDKDSLCYWAVRLTHEVGEKWRNKEITKTGYAPPPSQPKRHPLLNVVAPGKEKKRGKGASLASRISNLHSMANIEQWAIDLSWDIIARFSMEKDCGILLRTRLIVY
ncbi:hypothetical protein KUTeg_010838 [Tegillarca granosa]|uniref:Rieske domain-containing protein n=1 Tax=Tegillarca granosa TaxID=220873 RepID=A0ABQ9F257_TEGGR|nr:hypothetical protein KUTeg_010838 [Tegillarca granosa]